MWIRRLTHVSALALLVAGVGAGAWFASTDDVDYPVRMHVKFRDGSGLPVGSGVRIAGLPVGRVASLGIEGNMARINLELLDGLNLSPRTVATKRADSALADNYVSLVPGPPDPEGRTLGNGDAIAFAIEGQSTDRTLRDIDVAIERTKDGLAAATTFIGAVRQTVNGPFLKKVEDIDAWLVAPAFVDALAEAQQGIARFNEWTLAVAMQTDAAQFDRRIVAGIRRIEQFRRDLRNARATLVEKATQVRADLGDVDEPLADFARAIEPYQEDHEPRGTLARLIHEDELADALEDATRGGSTFTRYLQGLHFLVRIQSQYHYFADGAEATAAAEIWNRPDRFLVLEGVGGLGTQPKNTLTYDPESDQWVRRTTVENGYRYTAQFGKAFGPLRLRLGMKQSRIGAGIDFFPWRRAVELSADAWDHGWTNNPTVRAQAGVRPMPLVLLYGGVSDAFSSPRDLLLTRGPAAPELFTRARVGRDYFVGANLTFRDDDLRNILRTFSGAVGALL